MNLSENSERKPYEGAEMGKKDNRRTRKMRRKLAQRRIKLSIKKKIAEGKTK